MRLLLLLSCFCTSLVAFAQTDWIEPVSYERVYGTILSNSIDEKASSFLFQDTLAADTMRFALHEIDAFQAQETFYKKQLLPSGEQAFLRFLEGSCLTLWEHPTTANWYVKHGELPLVEINAQNVRKTMSAQTNANTTMSRRFFLEQLTFDSVRTAVVNYNNWLSEEGYPCDLPDAGHFRFAPKFKVNMGASVLRSYLLDAKFPEGFQKGSATSMEAIVGHEVVPLQLHVGYYFGQFQERNSVGTKSWLRSQGMQLAVSCPILFSEKKLALVPQLGVARLQTTYTLQGLDCNDENRTLLEGTSLGYFGGLTLSYRSVDLNVRYLHYAPFMELNPSLVEPALQRGFIVPASSQSYKLHQLQIGLTWRFSVL